MSDLNRKGIDPLPQSDTMKRVKRSSALHVSSLMATVGFSLSACSVPQANFPAPEAGATAYTSITECRAANDVSDEQCDTSFAEADRQARESGPRFATREACEGEWGPDQCRELNTGGGSFFGPLVTGFFLGQLLGGGRGYSGGGPLYRDRDDRYADGHGGYLSRDYRSGRPVLVGGDNDVARPAPPRVQSRTATVSRGGFGGGGRGFGG